jgi:hypothetical protein
LPPRRLHLTRTTLGVLLAIAFWLAAGAGLLRLAQGPTARAWMARNLAARLSQALAQRVGIADARVSLVPPRLTLLGVEMGPPGNLSGRAEVVEIGLSQLRIAERELVLSQLRLHRVTISGAIAAGSAGGREPWLRVVVRQLAIEDLSVEHLDLPGGLAVEASDVEARWAGSARHPMTAAVLRAGRVALRARGIEPISASLAAWGRRTATGWEIGRVRADGDWWAADLRGEIRNGALTCDGTVRAELAALEHALKIGAGLAGDAEARVQARVQGGELRVDAAVTSPRVEVSSFAFTEVEGEAHVSREGIEASLSRAVFAGGTVEGSYALGGFAPPWSHRIAARGDGVALSGFLETLGVDPAGMAAGSSFTADLAWDGTRIKEGTGTGVTQLTARAGDVPVAGQVVVSLARDGALAFATERTTVAGAPIRWEGRLTLGSWVPSWSVEGDRVPVATIARLLRGWVGEDVLPAPLVGEASLDLRIRGPFHDLSVVGDIAAAPVSFGPITADGLEGLLRVGGGVVAVEGGVIFVGGGRVSCDGTLDYGHGNALDLTLVGRGVPLDRVAGWGGVPAPVRGRVSFTGRVGGSLADPSADAALHLTDVSLAGVPFGDGDGHVEVASGMVTVRDLRTGPLAAGVAVDLNRRSARVDASLASFGLEAISPPLARLVGGALDCTFHGEFPFDQPSGRLDVASARGATGHVVLDRGGIVIDLERPEVWHLSGTLRETAIGFGGGLDFAVFSWRQAVQDLLGGELPGDGELAGHAELTLARGQAPRVAGQIGSLVLEVEGERATLAAPAHFAVADGAVSLEGLRLVGPHSSVFVRGSRRADGTLAGNVAGQFPAALLALIIPDGKPRGRVEVLGELLGSDAEPRFEGVARVENGSLTVPGLPAPLTGINGVFEIVPEVIALSGVEFQLSGGEGTCDGRVIVSPALELDLAVHARRVRWPLIPGFTPALQGELRVVGPPESLSVSGDTTLLRTVYRRELSLQKLILEEMMAPVRSAAEAGAVRLNLRVTVPGTLELNMPLARLAARGEVRVVGTSARPGVLGRLEVLPGGELEMSGVRYELDRATVTFTNPDQIDPFLDVVGHTTVQTWEITVGVVGTLERLTPTFSATPPLPEMDIIALLSVGRRDEEVGQVQAGAAASAFLTEQLTGAVTNRARSLLSLDQLRVDPVAASETGNPTARLTVAKQLSRDWTVTLSTTIDSNRQEVIVSRWRLGPGVFLEATRDTDSSYSLEVKWLRRY